MLTACTDICCSRHCFKFCIISKFAECTLCPCNPRHWPPGNTAIGLQLITTSWPSNQFSNYLSVTALTYTSWAHIWHITEDSVRSLAEDKVDNILLLSSRCHSGCETTDTWRRLPVGTPTTVGNGRGRNDWGLIRSSFIRASDVIAFREINLQKTT